jgi:hypothetical protein
MSWLTRAIVVVALSIASCSSCVSGFHDYETAALYAARCRLECFKEFTPTFHHQTCEYSREDLCRLQRECTTCWDLCYKLEFARSQWIDLCERPDNYCVSIYIEVGYC